MHSTGSWNTLLVIQKQFFFFLEISVTILSMQLQVLRQCAIFVCTHSHRWLQKSACTWSVPLAQKWFISPLQKWRTARTEREQASTLKMNPFSLQKTSANGRRTAWCYRLQNKPRDFVFFSWSSTDIPFRGGTRSQYTLRSKTLDTRAFMVASSDMLFALSAGSERGRACVQGEVRQEGV